MAHSPSAPKLVHVTTAESPQWRPDEFLDGFQALTIDLGTDPDGEGAIDATLVRAPGAGSEPDRHGAVLYVHGFTDYFFQTELADFFTDAGYDFYALDLRKCGRSLREGQQPHFTTDLVQYDRELNAALDVVAAASRDAGTPTRVLVVAHSTGGLITPLWIDRLRRTDPARHRLLTGLVLNSPWLDLQGEALLRTDAARLLVAGIGRFAPKRVIPRELSSAYGESLSAHAHGEWAYDLHRKPLTGFPVTFGWMAAVRAGQLRLHRGLEVGVPALVLRSDKSRFVGAYRPEVDTADCVLDVRQIAQWSGVLGSRVWAVAVPDARHDVFLSLATPRRIAYDEVRTWMTTVFDEAPAVGEGAQQQ
ncbi:MAG: alpha/beta hydrolase [Gordonia sp. (in: high G+C Gram-positive bacteria)]|uniref:alpha/beta hydrolase n=1 Tax=Gordonia sp. (in: high G+C Gram-positive bacteria) TaxID=84139 RepID=UPI003C778333